MSHWQKQWHFQSSARHSNRPIVNPNGQPVRERSNQAIYVSCLSILSNRYQSTSLSPPSPTPSVCTFISTMITGLMPSFDSTIVIYVHCLPLLLFSVTIVTVESQ